MIELSGYPAGKSSHLIAGLEQVRTPIRGTDERKNPSPLVEEGKGMCPVENVSGQVAQYFH